VAFAKPSQVFKNGHFESNYSGYLLGMLKVAGGSIRMLTVMEPFIRRMKSKKNSQRQANQATNSNSESVSSHNQQANQAHNLGKSILLITHAILLLSFIQYLTRHPQDPYLKICLAEKHLFL
jgi:hypothetical protein